MDKGLFEVDLAIKPFQNEELLRFVDFVSSKLGPHDPSCFFEDGQLKFLGTCCWSSLLKLDDGFICEMGVLSLVRKDAGGDNPSGPGKRGSLKRSKKCQRWI